MRSNGSRRMTTANENSESPRGLIHRVIGHAKWPLWLAGIGLFIGLILSQDTDEIFAALKQVGWAVLPISAFQAMPMMLNTLGWYLLINRGEGPSLGCLFLIRWVGQSVNNLLPVGQVGGDMLRARLLARYSPRRSTAAATVMVDFTLAILAQALFTIAGVMLLISAVGLKDQTQYILLGTLLAVIPLIMFYMVQRLGMIGLGARLAHKLLPGEKWQQMIGGAHAMDEAVRRLYSHHIRVFSSSILRLMAWFAGSVETWLIFYFLGMPITWVDAIIFESIAYAARSIGFAIPGALGVTEGALMLVGSLLGIGAGPSLAMAMVKRVRELLTGIPGLLVWMSMERGRNS